MRQYKRYNKGEQKERVVDIELGGDRRKRERLRETERQRDRETESDRKIETQRDREAEKDSERQRDKETERQVLPLRDK